MRLILTAATLLAATSALAVEPLAIQDNSFLVEEAYNQEKRVVQHIFTFNDGVATVTQEWPVGGIKQQLSYTVPVEKHAAGDTLINYRYQLAGDGASRLAIAPRLSLIVPSERSYGYGYDVNLPVSVALSDHFVTHWNAGATKTPSSREPVTWSAAASVIAAPFEKFHFMLESRWTRSIRSTYTVSPGVRWAWDFKKSGLQIVPGIAMPVTDHERSVYLYLSFEHPF
jgi:hypothetical protein